MATFTINSQKTFTQAPSAKNIFDKAFAFSIALIVIVGGTWGVLRYLHYSVDKQIAEHKATTSASLSALDQGAVQDIHDVTSRIQAIQSNSTERVITGEILQALERSTIPQVRLTDYIYKNDGTHSISGSASDYRFLAEQILRYRQEAIFATAEVTNTGRTESGQITFDIQVAPKPVEETPVETVPLPSLPAV